MTINTCADFPPDAWAEIVKIVQAAAAERDEGADALDDLAASTAMTENEQVRYFEVTFADRAARQRYWANSVRARLAELTEARLR